MATNKQCKMLLARSKEAGMPAKWEDFEELDNGDVDVQLEAIKAYAAKHKGEQKKEAAPETTEINGARFGMVYKIVNDRVSLEWRKDNLELFLARIVEEYCLATKAEEAVKASSSSSSEVTEEQEAANRREWDELYNSGVLRSYNMYDDLSEEEASHRSSD